MTKLTTAEMRGYQQICGSDGAMMVIACDQRGGMRSLLAKEPAEQAAISDKMLGDTKADIARFLASKASCVLVDPICAVPALVDDRVLQRLEVLEYGRGVHRRVRVGALLPVDRRVAAGDPPAVPARCRDVMGGQRADPRAGAYHRGRPIRQSATRAAERPGSRAGRRQPGGARARAGARPLGGPRVRDRARRAGPRQGAPVRRRPRHARRLDNLFRQGPPAAVSSIRRRAFARIGSGCGAR